jgi:hypothetical protein
MKKSITLALAAVLLASPATAYDPLTPNQLVDMIAMTFVHGELCNRPFEKALNKQLSQGLVNELTRASVNMSDPAWKAAFSAAIESELLKAAKSKDAWCDKHSAMIMSAKN